MKCKYCDREFDTARGLHYHEYHCCKNPEGVSLKGKRKNKKPYPNNRKKRICTEETKQKLRELWKSEDYLQKQKASIEERRKLGKLNRHHTKEAKEKISAGMRKCIQAGNRSYSFLHRKSYLFEGKKLDSSYELTVAQELKDHNIKFEIHPSGLNYIGDDGKLYTYFPDFYLNDYDIYLDPKNDFLLSDKYKYHGLTTKEKIDRVQKENDVIVLLLDKSKLTFDKIMECVNTVKKSDVKSSNTMESIEAVL